MVIAAYAGQEKVTSIMTSLLMATAPETTPWP
jgi:hypothetical protein